MAAGKESRTLMGMSNAVMRVPSQEAGEENPVYNEFTNAELMKKTKQMSVNQEVRNRRWLWTGRTQRKFANSITRNCFQWNPRDKRNIGKQNHTKKRGWGGVNYLGM